MSDSLMEQVVVPIFEGIHEKPPWRSLVRILRQHFSCTMASLVLRHTSESVWNGCATTDAEWDVAEWTRKYSSRFIMDSPFRIEQLVPGIVYSGEEILPRDQLVQSPLYWEVLVPNGTEMFVCICLGEPGGYRGWLYLSRPESVGTFSEAEKAECRTIVPLLQTALHSFATLMRRTIERDVYEHALTCMGIGTVILDEQRQVLSVDHVAEDIMRRSSVISVAGGQLDIRHAGRSAEFVKLCGRLLDNNIIGQARAMRIPRRGRQDLRVLLRSLRPVHDYGNASRSCLMMFISDPETGQQMPSHQLLSDLFGLTGAEAVVASVLAQGMSIQQTAEKLDLSEGTIRSHLKHIFPKTGVNRQADLMRVLTKSLAIFN